jgi:succinyl-CoA synthetase alpha subunit
MAILVDQNTRLIIQGITGHQGIFHAKAMLDFSTNVVGGVTPGKGGENVHGIPVFNSMEEAVEQTHANTSIILVPARFAKDAAFEAMDSNIKILVIITEHIPFHDALDIITYAKFKKIRVIGPNCPGVVSPGKAKVGIMPSKIFREGNVGIVSRSGTLTYEIVNAITEHGLGQSTCIGLGGDPIIGTSFVDALQMFERDEDTKEIVLVGEIGGSAEEEAAEYIKEMNKPVFAYIAGQTAPPGKRMGHAGAIVSRGKGTAQSKIEALRKAGADVAKVPEDIPKLITEKC